MKRKFLLKPFPNQLTITAFYIKIHLHTCYEISQIKWVYSQVVRRGTATP